ncbi:MAG: hypothetical protein HRU38_13635 [Saccharospirillaceae bacterium]|nr:hypothetical protein [Pseudomonadales bacterium]NRB79686.1 hypothetical protein [Saccharospirillaceae bacterium]
MKKLKIRRRFLKKDIHIKEKRLRELKLKLSGKFPDGAVYAEVNEMNVGNS